MSALADGLAVARRNVIGLTRQPTTVVFSTIQPVIFVIMFRYVFGGAMQASLPTGLPYVDFLMAGIFVQVITFGSTNTAVGLAVDLKTGLIERFRSLPMARSAVLSGRTLADALRNSFVITLMLAVGFLVGFRVHTDIGSVLLALGLLLLFGFAMSWVMAVVGLGSGNAEAAQAAAFPILAILVFASAAFVPTETMPGWLQAFANHQPVTAVVNAVRDLLIGTAGPGVTASTTTLVITALAWTIGLLVVFIPLATKRYRDAV